MPYVNVSCRMMRIDLLYCVTCCCRSDAVVQMARGTMNQPIGLAVKIHSMYVAFVALILKKSKYHHCRSTCASYLLFCMQKAKCFQIHRDRCGHCGRFSLHGHNVGRDHPSI